MGGTRSRERLCVCAAHDYWLEGPKGSDGCGRQECKSVRRLGPTCSAHATELLRAGKSQAQAQVTNACCQLYSQAKACF